MKRRQFMSKSLIAGLGAISLGAYGIDEAHAAEKSKFVLNTLLSLTVAAVK